MQGEIFQLRAFMERNRHSQSSLAKAAKVSQATVSRALRGAQICHGAARARLFTYARISRGDALPNKAEAKERLITAFERLWTHSDVHTNAIIGIIDALSAFPKGTKATRRR